MAVNEIIETVSGKSEILLKPENKAIFKEQLDPYFERVTDFKNSLDKHVQKLRNLTGKDKYEKSQGKTKHKLIDMDKEPGKDYIQCSNISIYTTTPNYFDVYYPSSKYGDILGWIPKNAYQDNPLDQLLIKATGAPQDDNNLSLFQFAIVAILYDAPRLNDGCSLIYFGRGNELADRAALTFIQTLEIFTRDYHGYKSNTTKRIINRLQNAIDTIFIELKNHRTQSGKAGDSEAYISYTKAIELSNGILTRKKLDKAINQEEPMKVRSKKPHKNRRIVHIKDVLLLIKKLSLNNNVGEEATRMFSEWKNLEQKKRGEQIDLS